MLTAKKLSALADAAESHAADPGVDSRRANALQIAAVDARAEAQSANGYSTPETLAVAGILDNYRELYDPRVEMTREVFHGDSETKRGDLARELKDFVERLAGFEGMHVAGPTRQLVGDDDGYQLPPITAALARAAFDRVDWHDLAENYLDEHKAF